MLKATKQSLKTEEALNTRDMDSFCGHQFWIPKITDSSILKVPQTGVQR